MKKYGFLIAAGLLFACSSTLSNNQTGQGGDSGLSDAGAASGGDQGASEGGFDSEAGDTSSAGVGAQTSSDGRCDADRDCEGLLPPTTPTGCAEASCLEGYCILQARDVDGDGHRAQACKSRVSGISIELGDDCDEDHDAVYPGAWDGPGDAILDDACGDGLDQDCSGSADDGVLPDGSSCSCKIGDEVSCSQTSGGIPIVWPTGKPVGVCRYGTQKCVVDDNTGQARWSLCVGAIPPQVEVCDSANLDDSCSGDGDDDAPTKPVWYYDADNDLHAAEGFETASSCARPAQIPKECDDAFVANTCPERTREECCPANAWRLAIPDDDCDDHNPSTYLGAPEICDRRDNDCSKDQTEQLEDADEDGYATIDTTTCSGGPLPQSDCEDYDAVVHPGAPGQPEPYCYGFRPRFLNGQWVCICGYEGCSIEPTWDYDCSGTATPDARTAIDCLSNPYFSGCIVTVPAGTPCGASVEQKACRLAICDATTPLRCH